MPLYLITLTAAELDFGKKTDFADVGFEMDSQMLVWLNWKKNGRFDQLERERELRRRKFLKTYTLFFRIPRWFCLILIFS